MKVSDLIKKLMELPPSAPVQLYVFNDVGQEGNKEIIDHNVFAVADESGIVYLANREW